MIVGVSVGEVRPGYELWRPNREKAESATTKVVLVILLAATSIIAMIVAIAGFSLMSGGTGMAVVTLSGLVNVLQDGARARIAGRYAEYRARQGTSPTDIAEVQGPEI